MFRMYSAGVTDDDSVEPLGPENQLKLGEISVPVGKRTATPVTQRGTLRQDSGWMLWQASTAWRLMVAHACFSSLSLRDESLSRAS